MLATAGHLGGDSLGGWLQGPSVGCPQLPMHELEQDREAHRPCDVFQVAETARVTADEGSHLRGEPGRLDYFPGGTGDSPEDGLGAMRKIIFSSAAFARASSSFAPLNSAGVRSNS